MAFARPMRANITFLRAGVQTAYGALAPPLRTPFSLRSGNEGSFLPVLCYFSLLASSRFSDGASIHHHHVHPFFVVCG